MTISYSVRSFKKHSAHRRYTLSSSALAVRSIDLIWTFSFAPIGEFACLSGLKFKIAERILLAIDWRVRSRIARQLSVAFTRTASLQDLLRDSSTATLGRSTDECSS